MSIDNTTFTGALRTSYTSLFGTQWAAWTGGLVLGLVNVMMFAYAKPWSVADGVRNWGDATFNSLNLSDITIIPPYLYSTSIINIGIVAGAMAAALLAGQFRIQGASPYELFKGLIGGALMGIGASMAFGCNIGGFFSAISALSLAGVAMMAGLMIGTYIGLRLLILETKYVNFPASKRASTAVKSDSPSRQRNHSIIGVILLIAGLGVALLYDGFDYPTRGGFLLFGLILGLVMQRTRFCFVRAFREPFMTGDGEMTKAVILAVVVSVIGFSILKWTDLRDLDALVSPGFWFGSFTGGIVFGIGMSVAGGCAAGSLWRAGEGQIKLWVAIVGFALAASLYRAWLTDSGWLMKLGDAVFLPDIIGWKLALASILGIMFLWYLFVVWNEASKKLVVAW
ncbi:MAG: YeeE/YedE thiosulfate transporter family protein [Gammaproteobacteria bacterium]